MAVTAAGLGMVLATGRCAVGTAILVRPPLLAQALGADTASAERLAWLARMFGARDLLLGVGPLVARDPGARRTWVRLAALADAADALALGAALRDRQVRPAPAAATVVAALGAAALGLRR